MFHNLDSYYSQPNYSYSKTS